MELRNETNRKLKKLECLLQEANEALFLCRNELRSATENIALKFHSNPVRKLDGL